MAGTSSWYQNLDIDSMLHICGLDRRGSGTVKDAQDNNDDDDDSVVNPLQKY